MRLALLLCIALLGAGCNEADAPFEVRAADLEQRLLASCSCHPKKISGLPLETRIREDIAKGLAQGLDDDTILWDLITTHGTELLTAGVEDLDARARAVLIQTPLILLAGAAVLLLQLRRNS